VLIETYVCFYQIFVSHETEEEKQLCYMLWKLDSLHSLSRYDFEYDFARNELQNAKFKASHLCTKIEQNNFLKSLPKDEASKIFNPKHEHATWLYRINKPNTIKTYKMLPFLKESFTSAHFYNLYKHCSMYTHSSYHIIKQFESMRGGIITDNLFNSLIFQVVILNHFIIKDLTIIDAKVNTAFAQFDPVKQIEINASNLKYRRI
jgi:hypothetical protein